MAVLTAFIHLVVFAAFTGVPRSFGTGVLLLVLVVPVLILHVLVWAAARLSIVWGTMVAIVLNVIWAAAGWLYWSININQALISNKEATANAVAFFAIGLVVTAILIGWIRFTRPRTAST